MHTIEPYYNWRDLYVASEDKRSPFYGRVYDEFKFHQKIYNYFIHPQWDNFGSPTLYVKVIYVDYIQNVAILEFLGEWNDCINNDIMILKRNLIDPMMEEEISKFILVGENILNLHVEENDYYEEWYQDVADEDGWISILNLREHIQEELQNAGIHYYMNFGKYFQFPEWRTLRPEHVKDNIEQRMMFLLE